MITHRRASLIAAAAAVSAAAAATSVVAVSASGQTTSRTVEVTQVERAFKFEDVAPKGGPGKPFTQGDAFVIGGRLLKGGKAAGKANLVCTTTQPGRKGGSLCDGSLVLSGGEITFSGYNTVADTPSTVFAVTGGTGSYAGASGTVTAREAKGGRTAITVSY
jgi:hypothetical protein